MAATPNEYTLKAKLQIVIPGTEGVIELGDVEVPIRVDFGNKPTKPGMVMRGIGNHAIQRDGL